MVIAPGRARRPGAAPSPLEPPAEAELESCPFCEGREARTPPETFALGPPGRRPDTPGWRVRVVPNLYPVFDRQEVVVHAPRHVRSLAELADDELGLVAEAWQERSGAAREAGYHYVHALVNEGRAAGASLPHSHSQLVWLRELPPVVAQELELARGGCTVCTVLEADRALEIEERDGLVALCPRAGRLPYELLIAPREHRTDAFADPGLATALELAASGLRRLHALEGPSPANAWLHAAGHWHVEVVPRLAVLAGVELGAGYYVNSLPPELAAEALRAAPERQPAEAGR